MLALTILSFVSFSSYNIYAQDAAKGEKLFKGNCASCHFVDSDMTGPALKGARERWIEKSSEEMFYEWIRNSQAVIDGGDAYANELKAKWGTVMTPQALSNEQIDDLFEYVETYVPAEPTGPTDPVAAVEGEEESSNLIWWILAALFFIVAVSAGSARGSLKKLSDEQDGVKSTSDETLMQSLQRWAWDNRGWVGFSSLVVTILILAYGMVGLMDIGVFEDYKPEQPIAYSHELHAGKLGIDCKYCHNSVMKSRHAGIPTVNVCMNCHKTVTEGSTTGTEEIAKIHEAAGYDSDTKSYTGKTKPIKWVKVHNLPDHVYFNHSQHVNVGGLDCKNCHGNMKKETVARVMTIEDLNNVGVTDEDYDENTVKFTKPTLTMGWCIECHRQSNIDIANAPEGSYYNMIHTRLMNDQRTYRGYLEDDAVSVAELGGLECAKCHY